MLIYVRQSERENILQPISGNEIPSMLVDHFKIDQLLTRTV